MAIRLRPRRRGGPEVRLAVSDPGAARRPGPAGSRLGAGPDRPAATASVPPHRCRPRPGRPARHRANRAPLTGAAPTLTGGVMAALDVVLALGTLAVVMLALRRRRALRRHHPAVAVDAPARLLGWAIGFLPADRAEWGQAMAGELDQVRHRRWRFALGCLAATLLFP